MKYIIRSGKVKGEGLYWTRCFGWRSCSKADEHVERFGTMSLAETAMVDVTPASFVKGQEYDCRIVRLLSHEESKAKAHRSPHLTSGDARSYSRSGATTNCLRSGQAGASSSTSGYPALQREF